MVDAQRDSVIVALKALARSYEKSEDGQKRDLARALMVGLDSIKHNNNDQYIEQTGQVDNLLYTLRATTLTPTMIRAFDLSPDLTVKRLND